MKHIHGIEIGRPKRNANTYIGPVPDPVDTALDDLQSWYTLGGSCPACEREGWVDRQALRRKWGDAFLASLSPRLRCLGGGNRQGTNG
jgi:hypothetical protein